MGKKGPKCHDPAGWIEHVRQSVLGEQGSNAEVSGQGRSCFRGASLPCPPWPPTLTPAAVLNLEALSHEIMLLTPRPSPSKAWKMSLGLHCSISQWPPTLTMCFSWSKVCATNSPYERTAPWSVLESIRVQHLTKGNWLYLLQIHHISIQRNIS